MVFEEDIVAMVFDGHPTDETLEEYSLAVLADPLLSEFEEHLLICELCQDRLALEDDFRQGMHDAGTVLQRRREGSPGWSSLKPAWVFAMAALFLILAGIGWQGLRHAVAGRQVSAAVVLLQATRGPEDAAAAARADRPAILVLDLIDLQLSPDYNVEIVDAAGRPVFRTSLIPEKNRLQVPLAKGLSAGTYFVRVYSLRGELLREYSLIVRG